MIKNDTFSRLTTTNSIINSNMYNLIIGLTLLWGFLANWIMITQIPTAAIEQVNSIVFIVAFLVCGFLGCWLFCNSEKPIVSFLGYNLVVIPFGFLLNLIISKHDPELVRNAIEITGGVTLIMMCLGSIFPKFFEKIYGALFIALIASIVVELVMILFFGGKFAIMNYIVALIFCGYIGYDWSRAQQIPKTLDNAIDSAASLYIDIINLFLRILSIISNK